MDSDWTSLAAARQSVDLNPAARGFAVGGALKRSFDILFASVALIVFAPLIVLIALCVKIEDRKAVIFSHRRVGYLGATFGCLKFRTMAENSAELLRDLIERDPDAAKEWNETQKLKNDPRVTFTGRLLRVTSLDELPQLLNVLNGDMSLVGPRPVTTDEIVRYGRHAEDYRCARPGLTGLWQVNGRNQTTYDERVAFDVDYVKHYSFGRDMKIIARTVYVVLTREGAC